VPDRIPISELIARHLVAHGLRDIFCEGPSDFRLINASLRARGWDSIDVFPIESIDVPPDLAQSGSIAGGNRGRLVMLAGILSREGIRRDQVAVIIDSDVDSHLRIRPQFPEIVHRTEFSDGGLYLYDPAVLCRTLTLHSTLTRAEQMAYINSAEEACRVNFAARVVCANNGLTISRPDPRDFFEIGGGTPKFDRSAYFGSWLRNQDKARADMYVREAECVLASTECTDVRHCSNSHCLMRVLAHLLSRRVRNSGFRDEGAIRAILSGSADVAAISQSLLFQTIGRALFDGVQS